MAYTTRRPIPLALLAAAMAAPMAPNADAGSSFSIRIGSSVPLGGSCGRPSYRYPSYGWGWRGDDHGRRSDRECESWEDRLCRAWDELACGRTYDALCLFDSLSYERPSAGEPRVGYAMAAALREDDVTAHAAIRRAFECDPWGARVPDRRGLDDLVECLVDRYDRIAERRRRDADAHFMLASFAYLEGSTRLARHAIDDAARYGDCSTSARNLQRLINECR